MLFRVVSEGETRDVHPTKERAIVEVRRGERMNKDAVLAKKLKETKERGLRSSLSLLDILIVRNIWTTATFVRDSFLVRSSLSLVINES